MPSITPVQKLNTCAKNMLVSVVNDSPGKKRYIGEFLQYANDTKLYGASIVSVSSAVNDMKKSSKHYTKEAKERLSNFPNIVKKIVDDVPLLKHKAKIYENNINKIYPNSLQDRIMLAREGAVTAETVEPKSKLKQFWVTINKIVRDAISEPEY